MTDEKTKIVQVIRPTKEFAGEAGIKRFAAYCRVSTDSDDQINSFLTQVRYYTEVAREDPTLELVDIYADEGITGTCMNKREEFKRLLKDCSLGKIDIVYVKSIQRFARNSLECLEAVRKMKDCGVTVFFENDKIDTAKMSSEMILYIKSAFAQNEALAYSKRVSTAYRMKMEDGSFLTYHAPYGYRWDGQRLIVVPEEAEVVKKIYELYLSGNGVSRITSFLNKKGFTVGEEQWNSNRVRYILSNEKYIGDCMLQKTYTPEIFPLHSRTNKGQRDRFYVENTHEAIISKDDYMAAQKRLSEHGASVSKKREKYLFSQLISCNECGSSYRRKEQNGIYYWVCPKDECPGKRFREDEIQRAFVKMYNRLRQYQKDILDFVLNLLIEARTRMTAQNAEVAQIDADIAKLAGQSEMYHKLHDKRIMDDVSFKERVGDLQKRLTGLRSRRMKLLSAGDEYKCIEQLHQLKDDLEECPPAILSFEKELFDTVVDRMIADKNGAVTFVLKGGIRLKEIIKES